MDEKVQKDQFRHWLPFYVSGSLGEAELNWMGEYLANHPSAARDVRIERFMKSAFQEGLPDFVPDVGLTAFMDRIQAEQLQPRKPKTFLAGLANGLFAEPRWSLAILAIVVQSGVIVALLANHGALVPTETAEWRSPAGTQQQSGPLLRITLRN
jgi:anti-sigma factor RsiW